MARVKTIMDETNEDKADILTDCAERICMNACMLVALAKAGDTNCTQVIYVDTDGNDAVQNVWGFRYYTWKSSDTFDKVANRYLGSVEWATFLAYYNEVTVESELEAGSKIKIPYLTQQAAKAGNMIFAEPAKRDNYGVDIAIDDDGNFTATGGDFATVSGADNLAQALSMRLTTASENRLRLATYGIRVSTGDPMAAQSYLLGSIEQTVAAEGRVDTIESITFEGTSDGLNLNVVYTDINGATGEYEGVI